MCTLTEEEINRIRNRSWMRSFLERLARNGTVTTTMHQLMQRFDAKTSRRTERFIGRLMCFLEHEGITLVGDIDLKTVKKNREIGFSINPRIAAQLFYGSESKFETCYLDEIAAQLGLTIYGTSDRPKSGRQFSPDGGSDKLDCLCEDTSSQEKVVLELKTQSGQGGLEQVIRYMAQIERHFRTEKVRGVLVSGIAPPTTVGAYRLLKRHGIALNWFLYSYDTPNNKLSELRLVDELYII
jgi:hypothetical protein